MTKRQITELLPTMKVKADSNEELEICFEEIEVELISFVDVETAFGNKIIATLSNDEKRFNIFVNSTSINKLIEAFGEDDDGWLGKHVNLTLEENKKFKTNMIILNPIFEGN